MNQPRRGIRRIVSKGNEENDPKPNYSWQISTGSFVRHSKCPIIWTIGFRICASPSLTDCRDVISKKESQVVDSGGRSLSTISIHGAAASSTRHVHLRFDGSTNFLSFFISSFASLRPLVQFS